ncbi:hypothetical protein PHLCEN_2v4603 [Hermanssonia centrifuga]|uniref:Cytochrome P450 n=1 Tax=Hermanssonia centrifuga TaxID=98765 RepID=A0A2R6PMR6_9APHY|nr:hypothetical protein PHLCEN_2v4603 [Hermanssonia centrifuga]
MDDEYIQIASAANEGFNQMKNSPGAFWMDYFPILKYIPAWVPGATGRKLAEQHVPITRMMRDQPFYSAKNDILNGSATPSIVYNIIDRLQSQFSDSKSYTAEEEMARDVLALAYSAGLDTSLITTLVFFVAMTMYPDVQKKAQGELDRVLGSGRLPTFEDRDSLPYIEAIILESIRWMPAVPLGVSHRVLTEDVYKGYRISKGSVIIPVIRAILHLNSMLNFRVFQMSQNAWSVYSFHLKLAFGLLWIAFGRAMLHNPDDYPCPEQFNPDRFIKDSSLDREVLDPSVIAFGFGRRSVLWSNNYFSTKI